MKKTKPIYIFLFFILILTACAGASPMESAAPAMDMDTGGGFAEMEEAAFEDSAANRAAADSTGEAVERLVIKNGDLEIAVSDPLEKMSQIMALAEDMGGFVVSSNVWYRTLENGVEVPQGNVTIRVPSNLFEEAIASVKSGVGQVLREGVSGQDVTQEYTDLKSRLTNLQAAEEELQRIMEEARDTEDVLNVYNQLINIREQIEVLQGRIQYFEQSAAFSAISVSVMADEAVQPLTIGGWEPGGVAKDAIQALIDTFKTIVNILIWVLLYLAPILVLLFVIFLPFRALFRRLFKRRKKDTPENPEA